jgi:hypothetical protein
MKPKDNPHIYGTKAWEAQKFHDQWQAKIDSQYKFKPTPPVRELPVRHNPPQISSPQTISTREPRQRSRLSPKSSITVVGLIVGFIGVVFAASHGVTSTLGLGCAFGFSAAPVVLLLKTLTKS